MGKLEIKALYPGRKRTSTIVLTEKPFKEFASRIKERFSAAVVITDSRLERFYAATLGRNLKKLRVPFVLLSFPNGERSKNRRIKARLEDAMFASKVDRNWAVLAFGGGVVGDMAGFIASTYMRGVCWFYIPTTLLAMVDASVGGKTAINTSAGKNLIGTFHQPEAILIDVSFLATLPPAHWLNGTAEIIKHAVVGSRKYFELLELTLPISPGTDRRRLEEIVTQSIRIKLSVVLRDETETGLRKVLNFGHTIAHAIESASKYRASHGKCVAYGMVVEAEISRLKGLLGKEEAIRIKELIQQAGFKLNPLPYKYPQLKQKMQIDKKVKKGRVRFSLIERIGKPHRCPADGDYVVEVPEELVKKATSTLIGGKS